MNEYDIQSQYENSNAAVATLEQPQAETPELPADEFSNDEPAPEQPQAEPVEPPVAPEQPVAVEPAKAKGEKAKAKKPAPKAKGKAKGKPDTPKADAKDAKAEPDAPKAKPKKPGKIKPLPPLPFKVSCLDAAAWILQGHGGTMNAKALIATMLEHNIWKSPKGLTPDATLYAAIIREIAAKGTESRFKRAEGGFAFNRKD